MTGYQSNEPHKRISRQCGLFGPIAAVRIAAGMLQGLEGGDPSSLDPLCSRPYISNGLLFILFSSPHGCSCALRCSNMEVFVRFTLLLLCFAASSGAAPTDNNGYSAITGSSDAWASLVANVVPLLILVGEKNVKSYFKTISQPSQAFLYAASPIGLVTAIVTAIRLGNSPLMKRLIGRQFESRAEVLADVSSISGGTVGFELRGTRRILEQTVDPKSGDEARFWIQGRKFGTGSEGINFSAEVEEVVLKVSKSWVGFVGNLGPLERFRNRYINAFMIFLWRFESRFRDLGECPYDRNGTLTSSKSVSTDRKSFDTNYLNGSGIDGWTSGETLNVSRVCQATVLTAFDASGENAQEVARLHAAQIEPYGMPRKQGEGGLENAICKSRALAYLSWPDVSETLTTNVNVKYRRLRMSRNIVAVMCVLINATLIVFNWLATRNIMTTSFISLGLAGSCLTSFWTAVLVSRSTSQETVSVDGLHPFRAGFLSDNYPRGMRLGYCPKQVVMSVERDRTSPHLALDRHDWITPASVFLTALAFILLYLGLRAAEWWVPFAMFGNVAFAACMRATLTIHSPLIASNYCISGSQWCSDPFSPTDYNWLLHLWRDLQLGAEKPALHKRRSKLKRLPMPIGAVRPTKKGTGANSPRHISPKRAPANPNLKEEEGEKLNDETNCWTVLSTCDRGARVHPTIPVQKRREGRPDSSSPFLSTVHTVAAEIERRNLVVTEYKLGCRIRQDGTPLESTTPAVEFVRSEFISRNGMWQQALEMAVTKFNFSAPSLDDRLITLLKAWTVEALLGGGALSKSKTHKPISQIDCGEWQVYPILHHAHDMEAVKEIAMEDFWNHEDKNQVRGECISFSDLERGECNTFSTLDARTARDLSTRFWSNRWMLWMAIKLLFALLRPGENHWGSELVTQEGKQPGQDWIPSYVDFLEAAELLSPGNASPPAMAPTHRSYASARAKSMDGSTGSERGVRPTQPSKSSSLCNSTSSERHAPPEAVGYMSFG